MEKVLNIIKNKGLYLILFTIFMYGCVPASWQVEFDLELIGSKDRFIAGTTKTASDGYDYSDDLLQPPIPASGNYVQIRTIMNNHVLTADFREKIGAGKKIWELTLITGNPAFTPISGNNILTWKLVSIPNNIKLTLIDYGNDASRKNIVQTIDIRNTNSYSFNVQNALGPYRYLDLVIEKYA